MKKKKFLIVISMILVAIFCSFFIYTADFYKATNVAQSAIKSDDSIEVSEGKYITFSPKNTKTDTAFIFYPGGKVEAEAYAPLCKKIAQYGYTVIIVPMPFKLAMFGVNKATDVIKTYPDIKNWAIGGHSLGGVFAASYAYKNQDKIKGLIFYASYPQNSNNIKNSNIKVLSLWGTLDNVADKSKIIAAKDICPQDSEFIPIEGGNHGQFGNYGFQKGDNKPEITDEAQQEKAAEETAKILKQIADNK